MAKGETSYLYPSNADGEFTSNSFNLDEDFGVIHISGWGTGDSVCLEVAVGDECNRKWVPFAPSCCGQLCFCYPQSQIYLAVPGRYRLHFSNAENNHLSDPEWFSNLEVYGTKVSSNLNLTQLIEGNNNMACGPNIAVSQSADGCLTIAVDGAAYTVCPGSTVSCSPVGLVIDGEVCPFPDMEETLTTLVDNGDGTYTYTSEDGTETVIVVPQVSFVDNGDCTGTLTIDGTDYTVITEKEDGHEPATIVSPDGTIVATASGPNNQAFEIEVEPVATMNAIRNDTDAMLIFCDAVVNACGAGVDINVDNLSYNPATQDITLTETDGTVHVINISDLVDTTVTNTSMTVDASGVVTLTDSEGNDVTVDLSGLGATSTFTRNANGTFTHDDGNGNTENVPIQAARNDPSAFSDLDAGLARGIIYGNVSKAMSTTELAAMTVDDRHIATSLEFMRALVLNRAAEPLTITRGVTNENGSIGYSTARVGQIPDNNFKGAYNGSFTETLNVGQNAGQTIVISDPDYVGQEHTLSFGGGTVFGEVILEGNFSGYWRNSQHRFTNSVKTHMIARVGEKITLIGDTNNSGVLRWNVKSGVPNMFYGNGWVEHANGTVTMSFEPVLATSTNVIQAVPLPIAISNPQGMNVTVTDTVVNAAATVGTDVSVVSGLHNVASSNFAVSESAHTTTSIAIVARQSVNALGGQGISRVNVQVQEGRIDFLALGGVANF